MCGAWGRLGLFNAVKQFHKFYAVNQIDRPADSTATSFFGEDPCCQEIYTAGLFFMHEGEKIFYFPKAEFSVPPIPGLQEVEVGALAHDKVNTGVRGKGVIFQDQVSSMSVSFSNLFF